MVKAESAKMLARAKTNSSLTLTADEEELSELFGIEMESPDKARITIPVPERKAAEKQKKPKAGTRSKKR